MSFLKGVGVWVVSLFLINIVTREYDFYQIERQLDTAKFHTIRGPWNETERYHNNNVVSYQRAYYICLSDNVGVPPAAVGKDTKQWIKIDQELLRTIESRPEVIEPMMKEMKIKTFEWNENFTYLLGHVVKKNGIYYINMKQHSNGFPDDGGSWYWVTVGLLERFQKTKEINFECLRNPIPKNPTRKEPERQEEMIVMKGTWMETEIYSKNDLVFLDGHYYISLQDDNIGNLPFDHADKWLESGSVRAYYSSFEEMSISGPMGAIGVDRENTE